MATIEVKAVFPTESLFGFYDTKVRRNGDVFDFECDEKRPIEDQLGSWMEAIEKPKSSKKTNVVNDGDI